MDYASSYAAGTPSAGHTGARPHLAAGAQSVVLPAPRPQRMHWSTMLFVGGLAVCLVALLATVAGVPARLGYDVDGTPSRNKPSSNDPMQLTKSLDGNMKWIDEASSDHQGSYVGYIKSINRSEAAIPAMVQALIAMNASVQSIDEGLGTVSTTTAQMREDMDAMAAISEKSAAQMAGLGTDIGFLSTSMLGLAGSTQELTIRMAAIERKAGGIADTGTSAALTNAKGLNASLPNEVPIPTTTDGRPLDQAMKQLAQGGGAGDDATTVAGAQPGRPLDAYEAGAAQ